MNVWGSYSTPTYDGKRYFLTIVDDFTRTIWVYLLKSKSECFPIFADFHVLIENQFETKIQNIRTDKEELNRTTIARRKIEYDLLFYSKRKYQGN